MYKIEVRKSIEKLFFKLAKKEPATFSYISKKIKQIQENPYHFKPLRKPLQNFWRVHIGNYVLVYSINEKEKEVIIEKYAPHNKVYR